MDTFVIDALSSSSASSSAVQRINADLQTLTQPQPPHARFYKSRKSRPCDACRRRKVVCHMPTGAPCQRCRGKTLACTFKQAPDKKKRPVHHPPAPSSSDHLTLLDDAAFFSLHSERTPNFTGASHGGFHDNSINISAVTLPEWQSFTTSAHLDNDTAQPPGLLSPNNRLIHDAFQFDLPWESYNTPQQQPLPPIVEAPAASASHLSLCDQSHSPLHVHGAGSKSPQSAVSTTDSPTDTQPRADASILQQEPFTSQGSLDVISGAFSFYIGPTGVSDALLLGREPYDAGGVAPATVKGLQYRCVAQPDQNAQDGGPVLFGITDQALLDHAEPRPDTVGTNPEHSWSALWQILDASTAWSLLQLYTRFVDPYFSIVTPHQLPARPEDLRHTTISLALLTAMCAAALPFVVHDRSLYALLLRPPSSDVLYRLCWRSILHELHAPRLCTLQACLLLQQRLPSTDNPTNLYLHDTAFAWSLMSTAVSVAQTLGLHREPSSWITIPAWERRLRRRLWWTLWTTETWVALARGMPRLLGRADEDDQDTDVQPLGPLDMLAADTLSATTSGTAQSQPYLLHLVRLTTILAGIQRAYYTLRGSKRTSRHLARAMEVGRPLHARLQAWSEDLPEDLRFRSRSRSSSSRFTINSILASAQSSHHDNGSEGSVDHNVNQQSPPPPQHLDGNASLHLSYIVTHMMLFRALLRPLGLRSGQQGHQEHGNSPSSNSSSTADDNDNDALHHAVTRGALLCVREFVEFVEALTPTQWNAFWHGWSRASFSMAGSFIVYLLHVVTVRVAEEKGLVARPGFEDEYRELLAWIRRWRWASRVSVHGAAGAKGLTNLMLLRVETFLGELGELCEL